MAEVLGRCPVCSGELRVTRLRCANCDTEISGSFILGKLASLKPEHQRFIETFVKCEGKIKDVEDDLGVSYPTVRARLREVIRALGYEVREEAPAADRRREILDALAQKQMTAEEAARLLRAVGSERR